MQADGHPDVLIVGAGPTGLALAAQLRLFGTRFRIIDRSFDRARESRALGVQARTLELFDSIGIGETLVSRGSASTRLVIHFGARTVASVQLGDMGATDTRFPFILFVSQSETERVLSDRLTSEGVTIERGVELAEFDQQEGGVQCVLRHRDGKEERMLAAYVVGCDGAHSTVRKGAGFSFEGGSYPQDFVLADVEADGPLEPGSINSFAGGGGVAMFFPLGDPTTWRVIAMRADRNSERQSGRPPDESTQAQLTLDELQEIVAPPTDGSVIVRDPAWLTHFRLHHRQIEHYRNGRVFLAGDAAHIHSPVGAQGMNTGIQDAWNLGWKLAIVTAGSAKLRLLDSYEDERWPVGRFLLRYTDRIFSTFTRAMSSGKVASWAREFVVPRILPRIMGTSWLRSAAFRFVSELGIRYRRSPAVSEGKPRLHSGPRAGDRLPDGRLTKDGTSVSLHRSIIGAHFALLLCGDPEAWETGRLAGLAAGYPRLLVIHHLSSFGVPGALGDVDGTMLALLGAKHGAQYLVRPDGYIAFRCGGYDLDGLERYLTQWFYGRPDAV